MSRRYHYHHIVTFDETNVVGNVYFAHYVHWQGHCRERFLAEHSPDVLAAVAAGQLALVTLDCSMSYVSQSFALDEIDVSMGLTSLQSSRLAVDFEFRRCATLVARGTQSVAAMEIAADGLKPVPIPEELRDALEPYKS